ncbi:MAG TPA: ATP-binding protein, partial [Candidatus Nitrosotenuis sp.]|nr:ATP-binding protein [Candidatus Nitrosotenuis sp.]
QPGSEAVPGTPSATVLVVDDDPYIRKLLSDLMAIEGHRPLQAADGLSGLQTVLRERPDVVLLDVRMPGMDGLEVCRRLKADSQTAGIPVFLVTALDQRQDRLAGIAAGADDFLSKPVDKEEVALRVRNGLRVKRLYDQLQESNCRLRNLERVRQELIQMMVHDLRSPLAGISSSLDLLQHHLEASSLERRMVDQSRSLALRMSDMLQSILDLAWLEEGGMPVRRQPGDLALVAREAVSSFFGHWLGRAVEVDAPDPVPARFDGDLIRRVLTNLIENAVRYTPEESHILVRAHSCPGRARLEVSDDGPGIPHDQQETVFDKYRQLGQGRPGTGRGLGLGLAFCRQAVEAHGGTIGVESQPGQGTRFWLELPAGC